MTKEELIKQRNEIELQIAEIEAEERRKADAEMQERIDRISHIAELVREFNADYDTKYKLIDSRNFHATYWF